MMKKKSPSWLTMAHHRLTTAHHRLTTKFKLLLTTKSLQPSLILSKLMEKRM